MNSIELIGKLTARLAQTFGDLSNALQLQLARVNQNHQVLPKIEKAENITPSRQDPKIKIQSTEKKKEQNGSSQSQENEQMIKVSQSVEKKEGSKAKGRTPKEKKSKSGAQKPKKPLSAYKLFIKQIQQRHNKQSTLDETQIAKVATKQWQQMDESKKAPYIATQKEEKQKYEEQLKKFYEQNPQEKLKQQDKKDKIAQKKREKQLHKEGSKKKKSSIIQNNKQIKQEEDKLKVQKEGSQSVQMREEVGQYLDLGDNQRNQFNIAGLDPMNLQKSELSNFMMDNLDSDSLGAHL